MLPEAHRDLLDHRCTRLETELLTEGRPGPDGWAISDRSAAVKASLGRLFGHGRLGGTGYLSLLPVDHGTAYGAGNAFAANPTHFDPEGIAAQREAIAEREIATIDRETIDADTFGAMLEAGRDGVVAIGDAKLGDKTLLDALIPAVDAYGSADGDFAARLAAMKAAAAEGRDSTRDMVARVGRSSRLGERSRGVLDAGATSCCLILTALADGAARRLG